MPIIRQYDSPVDGLRPQDLGTEAEVQAGRRIGSFYNQLGSDVGSSIDRLGDQYNKQVTQREVSSGLAGWATGADGLTRSWNQVAKEADPNDPTIADTFKSDVFEPWAAQFQKSFSTPESKMWAAERVGELREHFNEKTAADMSTLAGVAAHQNLDVYKAHMSNMVLNDPSSADMALGVTEDHIHSVVATHNLSADAAAEIKDHFLFSTQKEIARSTVVGAATANPQAAKDLLASGKFANYLDGTDVKNLDGYATEVARSKEEAGRQADLEKTKQDEKAAGDFQTQIYQSMTGPNGEIVVNPKTIRAMMQYATMPGAKPGEYKAMMDMASSARERQLNHTYVDSDPSTLASFNSRLSLPPGAPGYIQNSELTSAWLGGHLSDKDFNMLRGGRDANEDPSRAMATEMVNRAVEGLKSTISPHDALSGVGDPTRDQRYMLFQRNVTLRFNQMVAGGMKPLDAAEALTDQTNKNSIMREATFYVMSQKEAQRQFQSVISGRTPAVTTVNDSMVGSNPPTPPPAAGPAARPLSNAARLAADFQKKYKATH